MYFSVIIPTLNEELFLPRLLEDLESQTRKNFEVLVVDADSQDKTLEKAAHFYERLKITTFKLGKRNVSHQRNYAASEAIGDYLIFLDADMRITPDFIDILDREMGEDRKQLYLPYIIPETSSKQRETAFKIINFLVRISQNTHKPFSAGGGMVVERMFFYLLGGFDESLFISEDHEIILRAANWGVKAKQIKEAQVSFCFRRMEKEGALRVYYKYILATAHMIAKGRIDEELFPYEMGGQAYLSFQPKKERLGVADEVANLEKQAH